MNAFHVGATLAFLLSAGVAHAAPPAPGSEDAERLMPFTDWISREATNHGGLCCSLSDCRIVAFRTMDDHYEAFIALADDRGFTKFPGAPNAWVAVPADVIKRDSNPTGEPIACWAKGHEEDNGFYCFFVPELG